MNESLRKEIIKTMRETLAYKSGRQPAASHPGRTGVDLAADQSSIEVSGGEQCSAAPGEGVDD